MSETNGHVTKQDLLDMETRLHSSAKQDLLDMETRLHSSEKQDLLDMETRLHSSAKQDLLDMETRLLTALSANIERSETTLRAEMERVETKLLTEFWKWGRVEDQKMRRIEFSDATTVQRVAILEDRVFTLERKAAGSKE